MGRGPPTSTLRSFVNKTLVSLLRGDSSRPSEVDRAVKIDEVGSRGRSTVVDEQCK